MFRTGFAIAFASAAISATPASAVTTVIDFSAASCSVSCTNGAAILQNNGDTTNIDVSNRAVASVGNGATFEPNLRYWDTFYSNSDAIYAQSGIGEIRFDVLTTGTLRLDSVDFGGWVNATRTIAWRVYDLGFNLLSNGSVATNPTALTTINFGNTSTTGLIFQFGQDGFNGGIQNVTFSFNSDVEPVPEPANWAMLIAGFGLIGAVMRRQRAILI